MVRTQIHPCFDKVGHASSRKKALFLPIYALTFPRPNSKAAKIWLFPQNLLVKIFASTSLPALDIMHLIRLVFFFKVDDK